MTSYEWKEPPPVLHGRRGIRDDVTRFGRPSEEYQEIAHLLRQNPGRWLRIGPRHMGFPGAVHRGRIAAFVPAGEFEATSCLAEGEGAQPMIYIRYVGR